MRRRLECRRPGCTNVIYVDGRQNSNRRYCSPECSQLVRKEQVYYTHLRWRLRQREKRARSAYIEDLDTINRKIAAMER